MAHTSKDGSVNIVLPGVSQGVKTQKKESSMSKRRTSKLEDYKDIAMQVGIFFDENQQIKTANMMKQQAKDKRRKWKDNLRESSSESSTERGIAGQGRRKKKLNAISKYSIASVKLAENKEIQKNLQTMLI